MGEPEAASSSKSAVSDGRGGGRPLLSIVVPAHDESENLETLIGEIDAIAPRIPGEFEVILVDDGSIDDSWKLVCAIASTRPNVRGLRFGSRRGQTAALIAGLNEARGEIVAFLDADLQSDPLDLPHMVEPVLAGVTDLVCGWRRSEEESTSRSIRSRLANWLIRSSFDLEVHDPGCTLKVGKRRFLEGIRLDDEMHGFLLCYAQARGARISETIVNDRPRVRGESKFRADGPAKVFGDILLARLLTAPDSRPGSAFGRIALYFFVVGSIALGLAAWRSLSFDDFTSRLMLFFAGLADVTALVCLMSGMLVELSVRAMRRLADRDTERSRIVERAPADGDANSAA